MESHSAQGTKADPMHDTFASNAEPERGNFVDPTRWAIVVFFALLPFTAAYVVAGIDPELDAQLIAAVIGMLILVLALVFNVVATAAGKLRRSRSKPERQLRVGRYGGPDADRRS